MIEMFLNKELGVDAVDLILVFKKKSRVRIGLRRYSANGSRDYVRRGLKCVRALGRVPHGRITPFL